MQNNIINSEVEVVPAHDGITIQKYVSGIAGGRTLDTTGFSGAIKCGHVVITDGNGLYKPMAVNAANKYVANVITTPKSEGVEEVRTDKTDGTLPTGWKFAGVVYVGVPANHAAASIMTDGVILENALPYAVADIKTKLLQDCPGLRFVKEANSDNTGTVNPANATIEPNT